MKKIGIIGVGKMGNTILNSIISNNIYSRDDIILAAHSKNDLYKENGYCVTDDINYLLSNVEIVFLCIKPQNFEVTFSNLNYKNDDLLIVSIAAGIKMKEIENYFKTNNIIRAMPNTPISINEGITSLSKNENVNEKSCSQIYKIFNCMGETILINEDMIDSFIPMCGSMPAFVYLFVKGFVNKGIESGFSYEEAVNMVTSAIKGSVDLIKKSNKNLDELIDEVSSKGGTTIEGVKALERNSFIYAIDKCFDDCKNRSIELGKNKNI